MNKKEKIDRRGLVFNSIVFVERQLYRERRKYFFFKTLFVSVNVIILLSTLAMAVVSALALSGQFKEGNVSIPQWYPLVAAMIPAFGGFMAAIINFFVIKERMVRAEKHYHKIQGEIILYASHDEKYENVENKDFALFDVVSKATGYKEGVL